ncbi:hypothetical protein DSO57_1004778 [Entomophthora muscae]|uniref:Uncharacterized protein n=1 Tax=Entomophthora muscae TaxID=34485 RepID=A0ACC2UTJ0_9FUNG|nr:hypothetical protein DSO57_1004778 [Entomophthora muscae]
MHARSIFNPNSAQFQARLTFSELSNEFPKLKPFLKYKRSRKQNEADPLSSQCTFIDFKDPVATRAYNEALLKKYFDLSLEFLPGSLCPAVPNRYCSEIFLCRWQTLLWSILIFL